MSEPVKCKCGAGLSWESPYWDHPDSDTCFLSNFCFPPEELNQWNTLMSPSPRLVKLEETLKPFARLHDEIIKCAAERGKSPYAIGTAVPFDDLAAASTALSDKDGEK